MQFVAEGIHETIKAVPEAAWNDTSADEDYTQNNISHSFASVKHAVGLDAVTRLFSLVRPGALHTFSAARYCKSDHIAPHDDRAYTQVRLDSGRVITTSRTLAVIYYLTRDWREEYGGVLLDLEDPAAPAGQPTRYVPRWNSVVAFRVPRYHAVTPMTTQRPRYSIFGWFLEPGKLYPLYSGDEPYTAQGGTQAKLQPLGNGEQKQKRSKQQPEDQGRPSAATGTLAPGGAAARRDGAAASGNGASGGEQPTAPAATQPRKRRRQRGAEEGNKETEGGNEGGSLAADKATYPPTPAADSGNAASAAASSRKRRRREEAGQLPIGAGKARDPAAQEADSDGRPVAVEASGGGRLRCSAKAPEGPAPGCPLSSSGCGKGGSRARRPVTDVFEPAVAGNMQCEDGGGVAVSPRAGTGQWRGTRRHVLRLPGRWQGRRKHFCVG